MYPKADFQALLFVKTVFPYLLSNKSWTYHVGLSAGLIWSPKEWRNVPLPP
jgi:hypothetical protein